MPLLTLRFWTLSLASFRYLQFQGNFPNIALIFLFIFLSLFKVDICQQISSSKFSVYSLFLLSRLRIQLILTFLSRVSKSYFIMWHLYVTTFLKRYTVYIGRILPTFRLTEPWKWNGDTVPKRRQLTANVSCVISQKGKCIFYIAAEAWYNALRSSLAKLFKPHLLCPLCSPSILWTLDFQMILI